MAVFGVLLANEDDAERAVRAAFAMQENLARLTLMFDQEYGVHLVLRIGIAKVPWMTGARVLEVTSR